MSVTQWLTTKLEEIKKLRATDNGTATHALVGAQTVVEELLYEIQTGKVKQ